MLLGSLAVAMGLIGLGWAKEIASCLIEDLELRKSVTIGIAVLAIYVVDFAVNAGKLCEMTNRCYRIIYGYLVQACSRALIVDTLPVSKQQLGNAWGKFQGNMFDWAFC